MFGESFREMLEAAGINVPPPEPEPEPQTEHERESVEHCKAMTDKADVLINDMLVPAMQKYVSDNNGKKIDSLIFVMALTMFARTILSRGGEGSGHPMDLAVVSRFGQELQKAELLFAVLGGSPANVISTTLTALMAYITAHSFRGSMTSEEDNDVHND